MNATVRLCASPRCDKQIEEDKRPNAKFCSMRCRQYVACLKWRKNNVERRRLIDAAYDAGTRKENGGKKRKIHTLTCVGCRDPFNTRHAEQQFCSHKCSAENYHRTRQRNDEGDLPPDVIVIEEKRFLFDVRCLMCSRRQQDAVSLTKERARAISVVGIKARCFACNGSVFLEEIDLRTTAGSPTQAHNEKYAALVNAPRYATRAA